MGVAEKDDPKIEAFVLYEDPRIRYSRPLVNKLPFFESLNFGSL